MLQGPPSLSVNTVADVVRIAIAPVFLLSGIGAFVNVCTSRLSRIVDRSRDIEPQAARQPRRASTTVGSASFTCSTGGCGW